MKRYFEISEVSEAKQEALNRNHAIWRFRLVKSIRGRERGLYVGVSLPSTIEKNIDKIKLLADHRE